MAPTPIQRVTAPVALDAIEHNCARLLSATQEGTRLCAVVKANGYGHGMQEAAAAAMAGGASMLGVVSSSEAWDLRERFAEAPILIFGALTEAEADVALQAGAEISVWSHDFATQMAERAAQFGRRPRIHVKYDTGMGRLGEQDPGEVEQLLEAVSRSPELELAGLWTHFATADEPDDEYFGVQLQRFLDLARPMAERYPGLILHAANSAATLREPASHLDMVRCGVGIYGLDPFQGDPREHDLLPAMGLTSYVATLKRFEPGQSAGYGRRFIADQPTTLALIPVGYGDGLRRGLTNRGEVLIGGRRYPLVGTVSMDSVTADVGPDPAIELGEAAVLIGEQGGERILAEQWASRLETINYEITCGISGRVPRSYTHERLGAHAGRAAEGAPDEHGPDS